MIIFLISRNATAISAQGREQLAMLNIIPLHDHGLVTALNEYARKIER